MKPVDPAEQERLLGILARHRDRLASLPGVHHLDVGYRIEDGRPTGELAIRIHVRETRSESGLSPDAVAPKELEGVPVIVIRSSKRLE